MEGIQGLVKILLVEDNPDHVMITKKALKEAKVINEVYTVSDGQEAIDFLHHQGQYQDPTTSPRPGLILLDINMPGLSGIEVLKKVKVDAELKRIPVVMLTVSKRDEDLVKSYDSGCNSFIQKPVEFDRFVEIVKEIGLYWGLLNVVPVTVNSAGGPRR